VSFNPKLKTDPAYRRFVLNPPEGAVVKKVSWRDNPWLTDVLISEMEHLKTSDYDEYQHVWEGELKNFADGAIYANQLKLAKDEGRITKVPIESVPVHTFWDLGRNDSTAIWFMQRIGLQNRFIDYYEHRLVDLDHYAKVLKDKGYLYGEHYLPHDVEVIVLGANNRSRKVMLEDMGVQPIEVVPRIANLNEGIEATRQSFSSCWFDEDRCEQGLSALANYQYVFDEKFDTFRQVPLHNWASNGADAFRQFAQGYTADDKFKPIEFKTEW
jgi:phage terminase large subunit